MSVEPRWLVPRGWAWTSIETIAEVTGGGTPSANDPSNFSDDDGIPWVTPADLTGYGETYIARGRRNLSDRGYKSSSAKLLPAGAVLFTSRAPIGYCAIAANPIATNQGFKSLTLCGGISGEFTRHYLKWSKPYLESLASGTTFLELSGSKFQQVPLPLPPLAEQKRIVAKLDALNARSARARTELARIETLVARYKQAVLSKAFSGGWCPEEKTNTGPHKGLPAEYNNQVYPVSWTITSVGTFAQNHDARRVPIKREDRSVRQGQYRYYGASGPIDFFDDYLFDGTYLLVAEDGANLLSRSTAIAFTATGRFWVNNHAHILELADQTDHDFLRHYLESISLVPYVTGSAQPKLTQRALAGIGVVVPPPMERAEIVRRIESAFGRIDRLAKEAKRALELVGRLDEAILAKAFCGELVRQDENDEPAEHLLARIRAEREAAPKGKRGRGAKA